MNEISTLIELFIPLLVTLMGIVITYFFVTSSTQSRRHIQLAREELIRTHGQSMNKMSSIHGGVEKIQETLEKKIIPALPGEYADLVDAGTAITAERIIETLESAGFKSAEISTGIPAVGLGVTYKDIKISISFYYIKDTDDLLCQSFAFASNAPSLAVCANLLHDNFHLRNGSYSVRDMGDVHVYMVNFVLQHASKNWTGQTLTDIIRDLTRHQIELEKVLTEKGVSFSPVLLHEYLKRHNDIATSRILERSKGRSA